MNPMQSPNTGVGRLLCPEARPLQKVYNLQTGIGKARYVVNYHDGVKTHFDGSPFFDIFITQNKRTLAKFVKGLVLQGYVNRLTP